MPAISLIDMCLCWKWSFYGQGESKLNWIPKREIVTLTRPPECWSQSFPCGKESSIPADTNNPKIKRVTDEMVYQGENESRSRISYVKDDGLSRTNYCLFVPLSGDNIQHFNKALIDEVGSA